MKIKLLKPGPFLLLIIAIASCSKSNTNDNFEKSVKLKAQEYFETFSQRSDWDKFCSYYREDLEFTDVMLQLQLDSLWKFKRFYNWNNESDGFKKLFPEQKHLIVESLVVSDSIAVGGGHLNPFYYNGILIDTDWGMEFTIWLYFDEDLKIIKQIDWIEYDSYTLEGVIKRCRENGFEATPEWLDLSK